MVAPAISTIVPLYRLSLRIPYRGLMCHGSPKSWYSYHKPLNRLGKPSTGNDHHRRKQLGCTGEDESGGREVRLPAPRPNSAHPASSEAIPSPAEKTVARFRDKPLDF